MEMSGITVNQGSETDQEKGGSSPPEVSSALKEAVRVKSSVTVIVREAEAFCLGLPDCQIMVRYQVSTLNKYHT